MKKYKQNRKLITVICDNCNLNFEKPVSEYNRNLKLNRKNYCCRSCVGKSKIEHLNDIRPDNNISKYSNNRKDNYTGFRYYYRNSKRRFKEFNITLEDLKDQWIKQSGICPYSNFKLELYDPKVKHEYHLRASLDRIDSSKGYIKGNIEFISLPINYLKSDQLSKQDVFILLANLCSNFH